MTEEKSTEVIPQRIVINRTYLKQRGGYDERSICTKHRV